MLTRGILPTAIAIWLLLSVPAAAQQADPPPDSEQAGEQNTTTPSSGAQERPATDPAPAKTDDSPFDYQSSEEISEDLSVSFPVDI